MLKAKRSKEFVLKFTPYAWAKMLFMRDAGKTEVGMYGITPTSDPLLVTDVRLVKQKCSTVTVELDKQASREFVDEMFDVGLSPWQFQNIWIHTHPGDSPEPSSTDEDNFAKNFSHPHWAIFFIIAKEGQTWCVIEFNVGPGVRVKLPIEVDYSQAFKGTDHESWKKEYDECVEEEKLLVEYGKSNTSHIDPWDNDSFNYLERQEWYDRDFDFEDDDIYNLDLFERDGCIWYWDDKSDDYILYDPINDIYTLEATGIVVEPKGKPDWEIAIQNFIKEQFKKGDKNVTQ